MWGGVVGLVVLAIILLWLLAGRSEGATQRSIADEDADYETLEAQAELREAEEEIRELDPSAQPGEDLPGDDWGPGTGRPSVRS
jgi:hypothetical protein